MKFKHERKATSLLDNFKTYGVRRDNQSEHNIDFNLVEPNEAEKGIFFLSHIVN